jgi:hypothetical protein
MIQPSTFVSLVSVPLTHYFIRKDPMKKKKKFQYVHINYKSQPTQLFSYFYPKNSSQVLSHVTSLFSIALTKVSCTYDKCWYSTAQYAAGEEKSSSCANLPRSVYHKTNRPANFPAGDRVFAGENIRSPVAGRRNCQNNVSKSKNVN